MLPRSMKSPPTCSGPSGPFSIEAELRYIWGTTDYNAGTDVDRKG